ncbi:MAG TPA: hypothetical protein VID68_08015 [Solirubrobacteraceae bacterium]|jgi:DNA-directed RNA polymerase specialized sigma24 family protein
MRPAKWDARTDPAEVVARVAAARRTRLLRVYRRRLRWEDLEDCYSQATLELVARSRREEFVSQAHLLNALEQKFVSRIEDRRRAIRGRSGIETAIAHAVSVDGTQGGSADLEDRAAAVERQVFARTELRVLREVIADLTRDQQLVLASQVLVDLEPSEFCRRFGWSVEKYRKVAQRARGRLRVLVDEYDRGERCVRLESEILALGSGAAEPDSLSRARRHVANCSTCARLARDTGRAAKSTRSPALAPVPAVAATLGAKASGLWATVRRLLGALRHPLADPGGTGVGAAGGSMAGIGAVKVGIAVACVAGAAGGYAVCTHLGLVAPIDFGHKQPAVTATHRPPEHARRRIAETTRAQHTTERRVSPRAGYVPSLAPPRHERQVPHLSKVAEIRREFGTPPARAAAAGSAAAPTSPSPTLAQQTAETQGEFGFEK